MVDASIVVAALFSSQRLRGALALIEEPGMDLRAPTILRGEVFNTGAKLVRRGVLSSAHLTEHLADFDALPISFGNEDRWVDRALELALACGVSVFDAVYLACAEDLDAELWTADRRFVASFGDARPARLRLLPDDAAADVVDG